MASRTARCCSICRSSTHNISRCVVMTSSIQEIDNIRDSCDNRREAYNFLYRRYSNPILKRYIHVRIPRRLPPLEAIPSPRTKEEAVDQILDYKFPENARTSAHPPPSIIIRHRSGSRIISRTYNLDFLVPEETRSVPTETDDAPEEAVGETINTTFYEYHNGRYVDILEQMRSLMCHVVEGTWVEKIQDAIPVDKSIPLANAMPIRYFDMDIPIAKMVQLI